MVMAHKHHITPRHLGGTNNPDNLVEVSVEEHAEIHRCLWILGGRWQDEVAWRMLSGQIGKSEAIRLAGKLANIGKKHSKEWKQNHSQKLQGRKYTENHRNKISNALKGKSKSEQAKLNMRHSHNCNFKTHSESNSKAIIVNGHAFKSGKEAASKFNITPQAVCYRVKSPNYPDWCYVEENDF